MKFKPVLPDCQLSAALLEQDLAQARDVGKVRLGERCVYFTRFSSAAYLPYERVARAWLRQEQVNARLCCGTANFDQFFLMVDAGGGTPLRGQVLGKGPGKDCLAHIAARNPAAQIGYRPENG